MKSRFASQVALFSVLLMACCSATTLSAQDGSPTRSRESLRSLLGLPPNTAPAERATAASPASSAEQEMLAELDKPLLIPASAARGILPADLSAAVLSADGEPQDKMREQTQQQLTNFMRPMSEVSIDIRESNVRLPRDRSAELQNYVVSDWTSPRMPELAYWWAAPNIRYGQLYFENVALERYGQTCGPYKQVYASAGHLFCSVWALPFQMWTAPAGSCDTPLGYCRPGSATDLYRQRFILWK